MLGAVAGPGAGPRPARHGGQGYEQWGQDLPDFKEFRAFLGRMCDPNNNCPGCRQGGGPPFCGIRKCARSRGVEVCPQCADYPCRRIEAPGQGYPTLVADGQRTNRIGISARVSEQEKRAGAGFCYADIRGYPYEAPAD